MGDEETDGKRTIGVIFVGFLWIVQSAGRLFFAYLAVTQGSLLDVPASEMTLQIVNTMFILLGVVGFVAALRLWLTRKWGFGATILASAATIVFDIWGVTIQYTAAMGFPVPIISVIYLLFRGRGPNN